MNKTQIWEGPNGVSIPKTAKEANDLVPYARYLSKRQQHQIIAAFDIEAYDMAAEYAWKKAMVKLKETIATLGMAFIGEMLGRTDINESSPVENVLTDFNSIQLAEQLGVIGPTAALKLKQANELISHYFSKNADTEIDYTDAFGIVKSSIQYILGEQDISIAIEFSKFRARLLTESLKLSDPQVDQLINSPLFYLRTVITILIASIKIDRGAKLEHALANLNLLIEPMWSKLAESDKWNIGTTYRDVTASGNTTATVGLKTALLKVNGFDYVPENLRSVAFKNAAKELLETHFAFNNFYNEPAVVKKLAGLGSSIPAAALIEVMQAYLAVYIGNRYGISKAAIPTVEKELSNITKDRWLYYFTKVLQTDEVTLLKVDTKEQINRFRDLLEANSLTDFENLPKENQYLYNAILKQNYSKAKDIAFNLYEKIKK